MANLGPDMANQFSSAVKFMLDEGADVDQEDQYMMYGQNSLQEKLHAHDE